MAKKEEEKEEQLFPFEGKAKKEEQKDEKQPKKVQRIIPFEGKAKKEEKKETLASLFGERMLGSMPSDEVGVAPAAPTAPRLSAYRRAGRGIIRPFLGRVSSKEPRCHNGVFEHHHPSHHDLEKRCCGWCHT